MISVAMLDLGWKRLGLALGAVAVAAAVFGASALFKLAGWQIALGFGLGALSVYAAFRLHYGWWPDFNLDNEDARNSKLPRL